MTSGEPPDLAAGSPVERRLRLRSLVPVDRMRRVRIGLMVAYAVVFAWWLWNRGLIYERLVVAVAVGIFLVCAFIGRPWRTWMWLLLDVALYAAMWSAYEYSYRNSQYVGLPKQVHYARDLDRWLFFGTDPTEWMNKHLYTPGHVRWWEWFLSMTYYSHFIVPPIVMAVLWALSRRQWAKFMRRFATILAIACVLFVLLPTVPPWMAGDPRFAYRIMPEMQRFTWRGVSNLGFSYFSSSWNLAVLKGNAYAAMPSLHTSFATIVPVFLLPWVKRRWVKVLMLCFPVLMLTALVTFAEHWAVDGIAAWFIVAFAFWMWRTIERKLRDRRADRARAAVQRQPAPLLALVGAT